MSIFFGSGDEAGGDMAFARFQDFMTNGCRAAQSEILLPFLNEIWDLNEALFGPASFAVRTE
jgi:hypothetical protein